MGSGGRFLVNENHSQQLTSLGSGYKTMNTLLNTGTTGSTGTDTGAQEQEIPMVAFEGYNSAVPPAEPKDMRIVKCLYQVSPKTGKPAGENSYLAIPDYINEQVIEDNIKELAPYLIGFLQGIEDKSIKEQHKNGVKRISASSFTLEKIIASLEASGAGSRLNKETINTWFDDTLANSLAKLFADKSGVAVETASAEELAKLQGITNTYKAKFGALAAPKPSMQKADITALMTVLDVTGAGEPLTGLSSRLYSKLDRMNQTEEELLVSLY